MSRRNAYRLAGWWVSGTGWRSAAEPQAAAPEQPQPREVLHGYTLADLDNFTRMAVRLNTHMAGDFAERYELAWSGIAEHLCRAQTPPDRRELVDIGSRTLNRWMHSVKSAHGVSDRHGGGLGSAPHFTTFWWEQARCVPSPETRVVERLSVAQIFPRLTRREQAALIAMAAHGTIRDAAASLSMTASGFKNHLNSGRARFRRLWHEGEEPSGHWMQDRGGGRGDNGEKNRRAIMAQRIKRTREASTR